MMSERVPPPRRSPGYGFGAPSPPYRRPRPSRVRRPVRDSEFTGEAASALLYAISTGWATNRADLARTLGLPPSTITGKINQLLEAELVEDIGIGEPTGGRRPRILQLRADAGVMLAADLGRSHARLALLNMSGGIIDTENISLEIGSGPEDVLALISAGLRELLDKAGPLTVRGVGLCLPGPVDTARGVVESPASMPGWHGFNVVRWLADEFGTVAVADNDANMMALGEYMYLTRRPDATSIKYKGMLFVKAGTSIGCGIVVDGNLYRGATALAGDIAHVRVAAAAELPCSCGNRGCLETVVGGRELVGELNAAGTSVKHIGDIVRLAHDGDVRATTRTRAAGRLVGDTLAPIVNFFNPDVVVIGGTLSTVEPFVAAIRSRLYESCHPLATSSLRIQKSEAGIDAGLLGVSQLVLRKTLSTL